MNASSVARIEVRHRAVLAGRCLDSDGKPPAKPPRLVLDTMPAFGKRRTARLRTGGEVFFFLDVPAGRYALERLDADGAVVQSQAVEVPADDSRAKPPFVTVDFALSDPTHRKG